MFRPTGAAACTHISKMELFPLFWAVFLFQGILGMLPGCGLPGTSWDFLVVPVHQQVLHVFIGTPPSLEYTSEVWDVVSEIMKGIMGNHQSVISLE